MTLVLAAVTHSPLPADSRHSVTVALLWLTMGPSGRLRRRLGVVVVGCCVCSCLQWMLADQYLSAPAHPPTRKPPPHHSRKLTLVEQLAKYSVHRDGRPRDFRFQPRDYLPEDNLGNWSRPWQPGVNDTLVYNYLVQVERQCEQSQTARQPGNSTQTVRQPGNPAYLPPCPCVSGALRKFYHYIFVCSSCSMLVLRLYGLLYPSLSFQQVH